MLEPTAYGNLSYLIGLAGTFSVVSRFGLNHSSIVYRGKNNIPVTNQINEISFIFAIIASLLLLIFDVYVSILCFGMSMFVMTLSDQIGKKLYKKYMSTEIIRGLLMILLPLSLYLLLDISGVMIGMAISYTICSLNFFKNFPFKKNPFSGLGKNFSILIQNFGVDFSTRAPRFIDKLIVYPILGFTNLGIYQLNIQILLMLEMIPLALHSFLLSEESSGQNHSKMNKFSILFSIMISILVITLGPYIINEIFPKYSTGILSLQVISISIIPLTLSSIFNAKLQAHESKIVGYPGLIRVVSLLILLYVFGIYFELIGISIAVLVSSSLYAGSLYVIIKKLKYQIL